MLANKPISNMHRSPDQWDGIEIQILASTPLEKISILKDRIHNYIVRLPQIWYPRWRLVVKDIEDSNKLKLYMTVQHHINFQVDTQLCLILMHSCQPSTRLNDMWQFYVAVSGPTSLRFKFLSDQNRQYSTLSMLACPWESFVLWNHLKITSILLKLKSNISTH